MKHERCLGNDYTNKERRNRAKEGNESSLQLTIAHIHFDAFGEKGRPASGGEGVVPPNATLLIELELLSWKTVTEIGDYKKVLKKILKEGEGYEKPNDGSTVNGINFSTLVLVSC
ncbi:70 kDa peptidyl-prolyl isomerase [Platanthera zijinensis]|uniref:peptidylprolyl isomerase n=1 Tax=Platanthera zijinensis TaxID=2320716 RepID=A0AAP0FWG2_9ASPA